MATEVIHEHGETTTDSGMGLIIGFILVLLLTFLFFYYGLPVLRSTNSSPQINVPDKIDVNVNQPKQ